MQSIEKNKQMCREFRDKQTNMWRVQRQTNQYVEYRDK